MKKTILPIGLAIALVALFQSRSDSETNLQDYKIDGIHSAVIFKVAHLGVSYTWGRFDSIDGTLKFRDSGEGAAISVTVKADSINTGDAKRDGHLKSPDFFSTKEFPKISFVSKSWKKTGDATYEISGDLTLHGVTKSVTIPVTKVGEGKDPWGGFRIGFDGVLKIKRTDYGMSKMVGAAGDEITLHIGIEGVRKA